MEYLHKENNNIVIDNRAAAVLYRFLISLPKGGKFILPVNICIVVPETFKAAGKNIEFVDIDSETLCAAESEILNLLQKDDYQGVLLNHTYGTAYKFDDFIAKLKFQTNLFVIEDKCLCMPETASTNEADLVLFSTGYAKMIELPYAGGYGFLKENIRLAKSPVKSLNLDTCGVLKPEDFNIDLQDYFDDIKKQREKILSHKQKINKIYDSHLSLLALNSEFNNWRYNILIEDKAFFLEEIFGKQLFASSHYAPLHEDRNKYPTAYKLFDSVINLFNDFYFTEQQARKISELIIQTLNKNI